LAGESFGGGGILTHPARYVSSGDAA
jgi:hypothetical protein